MGAEILTTSQSTFLHAIGQVDFFSRNFYLTGGTALAAFHLRHRYSEDLDFFSEQAIDLLNLHIAINQVKKGLKVSTVDFQQSFHRNLFFCHFATDVLKIEFTFFPFPRIERSQVSDGISVDSLVDIAVNKLFTIYQRTQARDYVDLYWICKTKGFSIAQLMQQAKVKFDWHIDPLQLGTQFVKAAAAKDYPRLVKKISPAAWRDFFMREAKKLKKEIVA